MIGPCYIAAMTDDMQHPSGAPWRNFYGRFKGKTLRDTQRRMLEQDLPRYSIDGISWEENPDRTPVDLGALFGGCEVWVEIGFGGGEHLVAMAENNPDVGIIGCEPFVNGVAMALLKLDKSGVQNLRIHAGDARHLFDVLPAQSVSRAFLNYPDPWPKARHHRRRFVTQEHLLPLAQVMKNGARFHVATDIPDYVRQTLEEVPQAGFEWIAQGPEDWRTPWGDWVSTRYEQKALREGRVPHYLTFLRT